jgi:hypothetical protein
VRDEPAGALEVGERAARALATYVVRGGEGGDRRVARGGAPAAGALLDPAQDLALELVEATAGWLAGAQRGERRAGGDAPWPSWRY